MKDSLDKPRLTELPTIHDPRGCLSFLQSAGPKAALPFEIARVYWIFDNRGSHEHSGRALKSCTEFVVALSGSCVLDLETIDGQRQSVRLTRADKGVVIPSGTWREIKEISTNAVLLVVCSSEYKPEEIIRDYEEFRQWTSRN